MKTQIFRQVKVTRYGEYLGRVSLDTSGIKRLLAKGYTPMLIEGSIELRK